MTHLSFSELLSLEEKILCRFNSDAFDLGFLRKQDGIKESQTLNDSQSSQQPKQEYDDIKEGTKVILPLWAAEQFIRDDVVSPEMPKHFAGTFLNGLKVGGEQINLAENSPYYYQNGMKCAEMIPDDNADKIKPVLVNAFATRFHHILIHSQNFHRSQFSSFTNNLTQEEFELFEICRNSYENYQDWKSEDKL
jgi:hypothetical protein